MSRPSRSVPRGAVRIASTAMRVGGESSDTCVMTVRRNSKGRDVRNAAAAIGLQSPTPRPWPLVGTTRASRVSSRGRKRVISLVFSPTSIWARTSTFTWSQAARRWIFRPFARAAPRSDFPSTASPRSSCPLVCRSASQAPTARSRASASILASSRRIVDSAGQDRFGTSGATAVPRCSSRAGGASATHSLTASRDRAPARTAQDVSARSVTRGCRIPRGSRGSGTCARRSSRVGRSLLDTSGCGLSCSRRGRSGMMRRQARAVQGHRA